MDLETPWPVCLACKSIPKSLFYGPEDGEPFQQHSKHNLQPSFAALRASASRGCHACTLFYEACIESFKSDLQTAPVYLESLFDESTKTARSTALTVDLNRIVRAGDSAESKLKSPSYTCPYGRFEFSVATEVKWTAEESEISLSAKHYQGLVSLYKDDEGAFKYVRQSLDTCLKDHHQSCNMVIWPHSSVSTQRSKTTNVVAGKNGLTAAPTRLVDVGSQDGTDPARIVDGTCCLEDGQGYLALSYCNGFTPDNPPWCLREDTKVEFEERLPLDRLPQTLLDGIEWTRWLGERFIWIDNLCIFQDSIEDWNREASRMASIYGCATMTLVAAAGSIYGGMTDRRNPLKSSACCLVLEGEATEPAAKAFLLPCGRKSPSKQSIPTDSRAWCYQEDVLSPRLVRFSLNRIEWQCLGEKSTVGRAQGLERTSPHEKYRWYTIWYRLIERYSNKQLTYPQDKLTAFSGVANSKCKKDTYVAGVCRDDIWAGLLWARDEAPILTRPGRRYTGFVAPSWSWASLDVPVRFYEAQNRASRNPQLNGTFWDPTLHDIMADLTTLNTAGPVGSGVLELTAYALIATTSLARPNIFRADRTKRLPGRCRLVSSTNELFVGEIIYDVAAEAREHESVHCLLLHVSSVHEWVQTGGTGLGIAVQPIPECSTKQEYRRVGYVQYTGAFAKLSKQSPFRIV